MSEITEQHRPRDNSVLFLDDDVEPAPALIQRMSPASTVPRPSGHRSILAGLQRRADCFRVLQQSWWRTTNLSPCNGTGHRFSYYGCAHGKLVGRTRVFRQVVGRPHFPVHTKDYEFGAGLIAAGYGWPTPERRRPPHEHELRPSHGRGNALDWRGRPMCSSVVGIGTYSQLSPLASLQDSASLRHRLPLVLVPRSLSGDRLAIQAGRSLVWLDRARLRKTWFSWLFKAVRHYWYLRGVAGGRAIGVQYSIYSEKVRHEEMTPAQRWKSICRREYRPRNRGLMPSVLTPFVFGMGLLSLAKFPPIQAVSACEGNTSVPRWPARWPGRS